MSSVAVPRQHALGSHMWTALEVALKRHDLDKESTTLTAAQM